MLSLILPQADQDFMLVELTIWCALIVLTKSQLYALNWEQKLKILH